LPALQAGWEESVATLPADGPAFLTPDAVRAARDWGGLEAEVEPALLNAARRIRGRPALALLAWHCARQLFERDEPFEAEAWPASRSFRSVQGGLFYLLVATALVPRVRRVHADMGVCETVTRDTCRQISSFCTYHRKTYAGHNGIRRRHLPWLRRHARGELFRIGRLEYYLATFDIYRPGCEVYRRRRTGEVLALAPDGARYGPDGFVQPTYDGAAAESSWTATLRHRGRSVIGYPIHPGGRAQRREVALSLDEWDRALARADTVLSTHIPAGGGLTPERFVTSIRDAFAFFDRHFADRPAQAAASSSWMFAPTLEEILPATTNLVRNLREVYLWPAGRGERYVGLTHVFCQPGAFDAATAPCNTSLERAILGHIRAGGDWPGGGMFVLRGDRDRLGTQCYRRRWPPPGV